MAKPWNDYYCPTCRAGKGISHSLIRCPGCGRAGQRSTAYYRTHETRRPWVVCDDCLRERGECAQCSPHRFMPGVPPLRLPPSNVVGLFYCPTCLYRLIAGEFEIRTARCIRCGRPEARGSKPQDGLQSVLCERCCRQAGQCAKCDGPHRRR
jgi:hypothetical protein